MYVTAGGLLLRCDHVLVMSEHVVVIMPAVRPIYAPTERVIHPPPPSPPPV